MDDDVFFSNKISPRPSGLYCQYCERKHDGLCIAKLKWAKEILDSSPPEDDPPFWPPGPPPPGLLELIEDDDA